MALVSPGTVFYCLVICEECGLAPRPSLEPGTLMMAKWVALSLLMLPAPFIAASASSQQVELIAHRGESADAPENTLAAVQLAWDRGVAGVEIDVHLTSDDRLAVIHDADTRRTTGVSRVVRESTLAELSGLDAGSWKAAAWANEPIPTLEDVLETVPENGRLYIEVKVGAEAIPALARAIELRAKRADQLVIISFQADAVAEAKRRLPHIEAYYLASFKQDSISGDWTPGLDELLRTANEIDADGLDLSVNGPVDADFVRRVKGVGLDFYVWTVDDPEVARRMIAAGVDGITTNRAAALERELAGK
jgi:glycerophosphoryl diester phosphodiesterase